MRSILIGSCVALIFLDINPAVMPLRTDSFLNLQKVINSIPRNGNPFTTGRFIWIAVVGSEIAYFPITSGLNMADGWNIEGTPHNKTIWQHNIAIPALCSDYVLRNLKRWNVRSVLVDNNYRELVEKLRSAGFRGIAEDAGETLLVSDLPPFLLYAHEGQCNSHR